MFTWSRWCVPAPLSGRLWSEALLYCLLLASIAGLCGLDDLIASLCGLQALQEGGAVGWRGEVHQVTDVHVCASLDKLACTQCSTDMSCRERQCRHSDEQLADNTLGVPECEYCLKL